MTITRITITLPPVISSDDSILKRYTSQAIELREIAQHLLRSAALIEDLVQSPPVVQGDTYSSMQMYMGAGVETRHLSKYIRVFKHGNLVVREEDR